MVTSGGNVSLADLPAVTDIQSLAGLTQAGSVMFERTGLASLDGLQNLESVDSFFVLAENPELSSLRSLVGLTGNGVIEVRDNPALPSCEVDWVLARSTWREMRVSGNDDDAGCSP
jgi:hypothetical protein